MLKDSKILSLRIRLVEMVLLGEGVDERRDARTLVARDAKSDYGYLADADVLADGVAYLVRDRCEKLREGIRSLLTRDENIRIRKVGRYIDGDDGDDTVGFAALASVVEEDGCGAHAHRVRYAVGLQGHRDGMRIEIEYVSIHEKPQKKSIREKIF